MRSIHFDLEDHLTSFSKRTFTLPTRPNPDKFIPERFFPENNPSWDAFYPFSAGENNCIGKNVAWVAMGVALVALLRKFELELLPESEQTRQLEMLSTFTVKGESLKMKVRRRAEV